ncbi:uncharacterized protein PV06_05675 [Exophiala oligosperma]|uniref:NADH dehydrogenase [ubiquinone] 1 beta subcomplex subunit 11, mitochondrial n=2 Tax=Chaetothyriales TaxID=34395 RepID=A0A0D2AQ82_9EURO|nr:uncharacterized protein PV06_05675 [Exophiala oligosperma]KAJ9633834.1 hypothetical protein H2204_006619 [Knufia peltigerae]KIW42091.1 hypothetical protein PV06_05675 [Exophiala oligosperma]
MFTRLPRLAARSSQTILSNTSRSTPLVPFTTRTTPLRLASTHSAGHDDHGAHGHAAAAGGGGDHGHGGGHDDHFDPPGGWLWGQRPGEKYEKEGWEGLAWAFVGCWVVAIAAYTMKEDTSIQTWALEEARRRLEKEGFYDESK